MESDSTKPHYLGHRKRLRERFRKTGLASFAVTIEDTRHDEQRFVTVDADILGRVLVVVYAYSGEEEIRLIPAWFSLPIFSTGLRSLKRQGQEYGV
ncbi:MAG: BrnT family toxin [Syntrophales bacterium]|nr:BrnT family toxin [Syntrophales bacterium]